MSVDKLPFPGSNLVVCKAWVLPSEWTRAPNILHLLLCELGQVKLTPWVSRFSSVNCKINDTCFMELLRGLRWMYYPYYRAWHVGNPQLETATRVAASVINGEFQASLSSHSCTSCGPSTSLSPGSFQGKLGGLITVCGYVALLMLWPVVILCFFCLVRTLFSGENWSFKYYPWV